MTLHTVFIVIPVHNRRDLTLRCLESVTAQTYEPIRITVVDDGSTDGTAAAVGERYPSVELLRGDGSLWWSGATNMGVSWALQRCADSDYVLTLNDDTIIQPDHVMRLVATAQQLPKSLVGSVSVDPDDPDRVADGGLIVNWVTAHTTRLNAGAILSHLLAQGVTLVRPTFLPGRGTLVPVSCFRDCGLFDAGRLPHYGADYEFSRRAVRAGYQLLVSYEARLLNQRSENDSLPPEARTARSCLGKLLFSRRSSGCLLYRWRFALLSAPARYRLLFLAADTCRVVVGGMRDCLRGRGLHGR